MFFHPNILIACRSISIPPCRTVSRFLFCLCSSVSALLFSASLVELVSMYQIS
ncbi:hypothetical protein BCV70DRAFT_104043 [Testicularia cyperi]|uniref:Uncharacterized protein n=1 Tax=Testicularia cyperi TaxID=1882483 RepID=A0A317XNT9_9BASI|nr:hypothetical protein BCV70DRAFT_104043 [Testicularia cyperi]